VSFQTDRPRALSALLTAAGLLTLLFFSTQSTAIEKLSLDIGALNVQEWEFEGLQIALTDIPKHRQTTGFDDQKTEPAETVPMT